jgi:hypothetical protein
MLVRQNNGCDRRIFREPRLHTDHAFYHNGSAKWLVINTDWVRTARGMVMQLGDGAYSARNGVVAACRFWDIAQGTQNAGEVILCEAYGGTDSLVNNAFSWCHMYNCTGTGIQLAGSGISYNTFLNMDIDVAADAIVLYGSTGNIHHNRFEYIEMSSNLRVEQHCSDNYFNQIVALQYPLRHGNVTLYETRPGGSIFHPMVSSTAPNASRIRASAGNGEPVRFGKDAKRPLSRVPLNSVKPPVKTDFATCETAYRRSKTCRLRPVTGLGDRCI